MPKAVIAGDEVSRRRRGSVATETKSKSKPKVERGMAMRILLHSPKDTVAVTLASAAVVAIVVNALFLQAGRHPSPMFGATMMLPWAVSGATTPMSASPLPRPRPSEASIGRDEMPAADAGPTETKSIDSASHSMKATNAPRANTVKQAAAHASTGHSDPLGDLITSSRRIAGVQRALTKFGYGQLKATGTVGSDTQAAIQKFERERKLPVTGQISDRLVRELSAVTGQAID